MNAETEHHPAAGADGCGICAMVRSDPPTGGSTRTSAEWRARCPFSRFPAGSSSPFDAMPWRRSPLTASEAARLGPAIDAISTALVQAADAERVYPVEADRLADRVRGLVRAPAGIGATKSQA